MKKALLLIFFLAAGTSQAADINPEFSGYYHSDLYAAQGYWHKSFPVQKRATIHVQVQGGKTALVTDTRRFLNYRVSTNKGNNFPKNYYSKVLNKSNLNYIIRKMAIGKATISGDTLKSKIVFEIGYTTPLGHGLKAIADIPVSVRFVEDCSTVKKELVWDDKGNSQPYTGKCLVLDSGVATVRSMKTGLGPDADKIIHVASDFTLKFISNLVGAKGKIMYPVSN